MFKGSIVALITPFRGGEIDEPALRDLIDWHVAEGTHGIVAVGTTGESPTLSHAEHKRVVEIAVQQSAGRVPVIAGTGSNNTVEAIELTCHAKSIGADAALVVTPYYNKPNQEGLYRHYVAICDAADLPVIVYNIPGRSVIDMTVETMARLASHRNVVGVKDATGDIARVSQTRLAIGPDFVQLSGEDATALALLAHGGHGCISVTANVAPKLCAQLYEAWAAGDAAGALELQDRLMPLHEALFVEPNPCPAKWALEKLGKCAAEVRMPLVPVGEATADRIGGALRHAGLIN